MLETSQPPAYYLPPSDVATDHLRPSDRQSYCEWKGAASYFDVVVADGVVATRGRRVDATRRRTNAFEPIRDHLAFYAQQFDACFVDGERVQANDGDFYGGWVNSWIVGPFKGGPGTLGW